MMMAVSVLRTIWLPAVLALYTLLIYLAVWGDRGLIHLARLGEEQRHLEKQVRQLLSENTDLKSRIERVHGDDFFLEKVARETLGLVRDYEIIYRRGIPGESNADD